MAALLALLCCVCVATLRAPPAAAAAGVRVGDLGTGPDGSGGEFSGHTEEGLAAEFSAHTEEGLAAEFSAHTEEGPAAEFSAHTEEGLAAASGEGGEPREGRGQGEPSGPGDGSGSGADGEEMLLPAATAAAQWTRDGEGAPPATAGLEPGVSWDMALDALLRLVRASVDGAAGPRLQQLQTKIDTIAAEVLHGSELAGNTSDGVWRLLDGQGRLTDCHQQLQGVRDGQQAILQLRGLLQHLQTDHGLLKAALQRVDGALTEHQAQTRSGLSALQAGQTELQTVAIQLKTGQTELQASQTQLKRQLQEGQAQLQTGQTQLQTNQTQLQTAVQSLLTDLPELKSGQQRLQSEQPQLQEGQTQLQAGQQRLRTLLEAVQQQVTSPQPAAADCRADWSRRGHSCYLIPPEKATWYKAHRACALIDARATLASVHPDTAQHIVDMFRTSGASHIWIGLAREAGTPGWGWSDGTPLDYAKWLPNEPNNSGGIENCVHGYGAAAEVDKGWNDRVCSATSAFLCQITLE